MNEAPFRYYGAIRRGYCAPASARFHNAVIPGIGNPIMGHTLLGDSSARDIVDIGQKERMSRVATVRIVDDCPGGSLHPTEFAHAPGGLAGMAKVRRFATPAHQIGGGFSRVG